MAQLANPTHRDWVSQVLQELEDLNLNSLEEQIYLIRILKENFKLRQVED